MRFAVATAVPDGASILPSWCSSMISALSKYGAANSAKRIISTALIAKLGTMMQLLPLNSDRKASMSASLKPVVPTTACTPCIASHGTVTRAESALVKSTTTSQPASASDRRSPVMETPCRLSPTRMWSDRRDQFEVGVERDGRTDRSSHSSPGSDNTDLDLRHTV